MQTLGLVLAYASNPIAEPFQKHFSKKALTHKA